MRNFAAKWLVFPASLLFGPCGLVQFAQGAETTLQSTEAQYVHLKAQMREFERAHSRELRQLRIEKAKKRLADLEAK